MGSNYHLHPRDAADRKDDMKFFLSYGNHKSASTADGIELAKSLLYAEAGFHRVIPVPTDIPSIVGSELCALGIATQFTISPEGELIDKHQGCHDLTFARPSGQLLNKRVKKNLLEPCIYGHCLQRIITFIAYLHWHHPDQPILMSRSDLDAAYHRVHVAWHLATQCIMLLGGIEYLLLRLPFGAAAAPAKFCVASEIVHDVVNALLQDTTWDPGGTPMQYDELLPSPTLLDTSTPFAPAMEMDVNLPPSTFPCLTDIYFDDLIKVGLALPHLIPRLQSATAVAIHCIFRPAHPLEFDWCLPALSLRKLVGEGQLAEIKTILGWVINTRALTIHLSAPKHLAWTKDIHRLLTQGFTSKADLDTTIGHLNHVGFLLPLCRHFLPRLWHFCTNLGTVALKPFHQANRKTSNFGWPFSPLLLRASASTLLHSASLRSLAGLMHV